MILELSGTKSLRLRPTNEKIFKGELNAGKLELEVKTATIADLYSVFECEFFLCVANAENEILKHKIDLDKSNKGFVLIDYDITEKVQTVKCYVEITKGEQVIGKSNVVELKVENSVDGVEVVPRSELEAELAEIYEANAFLEQVLNGTYEGS
jgi:hypothetical protein